VDEARRLRGVVLESLDQEQDAKSLARHAYRSRTQFYRLFRAMIEETPVAMRRRLLLERAAWQLSRTQLPVTDISLNANQDRSKRSPGRSERRFASPPACIAEWARHILTCTRRTEFIIIPVKMT
jgi:transcriptional regulator GlxA family with amidase domain